MTTSDTRSRVLAAAAHRLQHAPLRELTLAGVARTAGVSRPTVYRYFADASDLAAAVFVDFAREHFLPSREALLAGPLDAAALEALFWADVDAARTFFAGTEPEASSVLSAHLVDFILTSEPIREHQRQVWVPALERFREAGVLRPGLDLADTADWLTYQQGWLSTHPAALGSAEEARRKTRTHVIDPLLQA